MEIKFQPLHVHLTDRLLPLLYLYLYCTPPGNKYGEPVVCGFARSFGQRLPNKERVEWIKPIMFTAGLGWLDSRHTVKGL